MSQPAGFALNEDPEGRTLVVTGPWNDKAALILASGQASGLVLNYARGYRERDLSFLDQWPVRRLSILARTVDDIEPIYRLADTLEELSLTTSPRARLDCSRLPRLRSLWVENWEQIRGSLPGAGGLERLGVHGYQESDLLAVSENRNLKEIRLKQAPRLESLHGVDWLAQLQRLLVAGAHRLGDLGALRNQMPNLGALSIEACGGITDLNDIAHQSGLRELWVANCGPIASAAPLTTLGDLERLYLYESTRFTDGDLSPILQLTRLTDFRMMNRRHYRPTVKEIKSRLGISY